MGHQIISDSKLQFYPTNQDEIIRSLSILNMLDRKGCGASEKFQTLIGRERYDELFQMKTNMRFNQVLLDELIMQKKYKEIAEYYHGYCLDDMVIADLFAGEGEWLKTYISILKSKEKVKTIGNELEENRYNKMINEEMINYSYNSAFEDLELPKKIINLMLFNPPYGITNGERNVRRYLRMILEREYMAAKSWIVCALKTRDIIDCSDLFTQYFEVEKVLAYKMHKEEFEKFGQQMLYLKKREIPLNLNNINDLSKYKQHKDSFNAYIETEFEIEDFMYKSLSFKIKLDKIDLLKAFDNYKYLKANKPKLSNKKSKAYKWITEETLIKDLSEELMTIPKPLKGGELANVIASGKINGEISLETGEGEHIAVGGVKKMNEVSKINIEKKGKIERKQKTIVKSEPYLNVLINDNGILKFKNLSSIGLKESGDER